MAKKGDWLIIAVLVVGVLLLAGKIQLPFSATTTQTSTVIQQSYGSLVAFSVKALNALTAGQVAGNAELISVDGTTYVGETSVGSSGMTQLSSSLPNKFNGYVMFGNDNFIGTDRGTEYYYTKVPVSWDTQGLVVKDNIMVYAEQTTNPFSFYDDNIKESTPNITIGAGEAYRNAVLKITSNTKEAIGNPELPNSVALCFAESTKGLFKTIKPVNNRGEITAPKFLQSYNIVSCYVVSDSLKDGQVFTTDLYIEADASRNPTVNDYIDVILLDKTYYKDEYGKWAVGFGFDNSLGTSTDVGINTTDIGTLRIHTA